jgi:hypothetical protein
LQLARLDSWRRSLALLASPAGGLLRRSGTGRDHRDAKEQGGEQDGGA